MPRDAGSLAGLLNRRGRAREEDAQRLAAALGGNAERHVQGPLAVAWTGDASAADGERLAVVGGRLYAPHEGAAALLHQWDGGDPPAAVRGDFGLLLWDARRERGLLAADQMGQRTLFWHDDGARLRFAGEIHQLLALLPATPAPDPRALLHWITVSGMPKDLTFYTGIHRLGAGRRIAIGTGTGPARPRRWWPPPLGDCLEVDAEVAAGMLRERLVTAVRRRARPEGATGVLLSGGLDSSSVAGVAATVGEGLAPRRAYSAVFPEHPAVDESGLIAATAHQAGLASTRVVVRGGSILSGALPYLERWAVPPVSPNLFFWAPLLQRAADDGTEVLLDGEGGDEIFGLSPYAVADLLVRGRLRAARDLGLQVPNAPERLTREQARSWLWRFGFSALVPPGAHTVSRTLRPAIRYVPDWVRPERARDFVRVADGAEWKRHRGPRWRRWILWATSSGLGPALLYDHVRHRGLMHGIEPRHPLPDVDVMELMLRLPPELSFDTRHTRPLLRAAVRGLVPEPVRTRAAKSNFDEVFHASLAGRDLPLARRLLGPDARMGEYVDLRRLWEQMLEHPPADAAGRRGWAVPLWRLMTGECWLRSLEDAAAPRRVAEEVGMQPPDCALIEA